MTSASRVIEIHPLHAGGIVGVARARHIIEKLVIPGAGIPVPENDGERGSRGESLIYSAENLGYVGLDSRGRALWPAFPAENVLREIVDTEREARLNSVKHDAYRIAVGFSENGDSEFAAE